MSDGFWQSLFGAVTAIILAWIAWQNRKLQQGQEVAATKVKQVAIDLKARDAEKNDKLDNLTELADKTHSLVNSAMGAQLRLHADTAKRLADETGEAEDIEAARLAEQALKDYLHRQNNADRENDP